MEILNNDLYRIVATALVYKPDYTYLITKRSLHKKVMPGKWTIPGGGVESRDYINTPTSTEANQWYDTIKNTINREIREEVGLEVGKSEFLTDYIFIRPDGVHVLGLSYFTPYVSGEVVLDSDATEFAWIRVDQIRSYDLIPGIAGEIIEVDKILKSRKLS